jgi:peptidyl-prolyl cis-trans isomerase C
MSVFRLSTILTVILMLFFNYACSQGQQSGKQAPSAEEASEVIENAAAVVNTKPIPMSELQTAVRNVVMQNGMDPENLESFMAQFGPRILDQLIEGELLFQAAQKGGFMADQEDVDAAFAELAGRYELPEQFQKEMESRGFSEASLRANISKQMSIQKLIQETVIPKAVVPDETIREAYDQNPENFTREEEVKASHILINSAEGDPKEKRDEALKKAREIAVKARAEGADFAELARTYSEGPSAPSGGDLGFFSRGRMVKPFEEAAFSLKVNEVSDPILTQFGYHIIKVTERRESSTVPFEDVKDQLRQDLKNRMINELIGRELSQLRAKADIKVLYVPAGQQTPDGTTEEEPAK